MPSTRRSRPRFCINHVWESISLAQTPRELAGGRGGEDRGGDDEGEGEVTEETEENRGWMRWPKCLSFYVGF